MYCGQCGKKVLENMLFCPFCGSPIVIPEQDDPPAIEKSVPQSTRQAAPELCMNEQEEEKVEELRVQEGPVSLFDTLMNESVPRLEEEMEPEQEAFVPLSFDFDESKSVETVSGEQETITGTEEEAIEVAETEEEAQAEEQNVFDVADEPVFHVQPVRRPSNETRRPENAQKRSANTFIPVKEIDPEDMFMDDLDTDDGYDVDDYDMDNSVRSVRYEDEFEFEEAEHGNFFQRHIRGIVGLILLLILMVICTIWAFSGRGQLALARMNLAWTAQSYATLGHEAYQQNSKLLAAQYFEKAYAREETNYEYAHSAMVAYYDAENIESAATMLKKCIGMAPDNPEPYQEMLVLYPDAQTRPWEISELIRLGYQRTGDESLNVG